MSDCREKKLFPQTTDGRTDGQTIGSFSNKERTTKNLISQNYAKNSLKRSKLVYNLSKIFNEKHNIYYAILDIFGEQFLKHMKTCSKFL